MPLKQKSASRPEVMVKLKYCPEMEFNLYRFMSFVSFFFKFTNFKLKETFSLFVLQMYLIK